MRHFSGKFARGGAIAGAALVGLCAASAFAADGTLKLEQDDPSQLPEFFNGNVGGGEFGVYDLNITNAAITFLPIAPAAKVIGPVNGHGPFDFQTFCVEHAVHVDFNVNLNFTVSTAIQFVGGGTQNLHPETAYVFWKFYTANAFTSATPYNYTLGHSRVLSAADAQLAIWFFELQSNYQGGNVGTLIAEAQAAVALNGAWDVFVNHAGFPGNLGGVRALNLELNGQLLQDVLAIVGEEPPPPPDGDCSGLTPGFWHNKNGCDLVKESGAGAAWSWLTTINALPLVDGTKDGHYLADVPLSKSGFSTISDFLVSGNNAKNMAQKLSQHVCAMQFNILSGLADDDCLVYTGANADCIPGSPDTVEIGVVMDLAIASLTSDPYTPAGDDQRDYQECLKNILDAANNNLNWVH